MTLSRASNRNGLERAVERQALKRRNDALAQLSVFRGGFTPESGAAVVDLTAFKLAPPRLETIVALHRKSLLHHFVAPEAPRTLRLKVAQYDLQHAFRETGH